MAVFPVRWASRAGTVEDMKRIMVCVGMVGVLAVAGCGGGPEVSDPPAGQAVSDPAAAEGGASSSSAAPVADVHEWGATATWPDGVKVTVGEPVSYKPSQYAAGVTSGVPVVAVPVTVVNGSEKPIEAADVYVRATSGDVDAEAVFDEGVDFPSSRIMPGKSLRFRSAFSRPGDDLVVTVDHGFESVTFGG